MRNKAKTPILLWVFLLVLFVWGCGRAVTDEERVGAVIEAVRAAASERDIGTIKEQIAEDYHDKEGRGVPEIHAVLSYYFFHTRYPVLVVRNTRITVRGTTANARVDLLFADRRTPDPEEVIPEYAVLYQFDVGFVKRADRWLVKEASWRRLGDPRS